MSSDPEVIGWLGMAYRWASGMASSCFRQGDEMLPASQGQQLV